MTHTYLLAHSCTADISLGWGGGRTGEEQKIVLGLVSTLAEDI